MTKEVASKKDKVLPWLCLIVMVLLAVSACYKVGCLRDFCYLRNCLCRAQGFEEPVTRSELIAELEEQIANNENIELLLRTDREHELAVYLLGNTDYAKVWQEKEHTVFLHFHMAKRQQLSIEY